MASSSEWLEINPSTLPAETASAYAEMKTAYRKYAEMKKSFEAKMQQDFADQLAPGRELKFGYNFGKLSIAIGEARDRREAKPKQSLAEWLEAQRQ